MPDQIDWRTMERDTTAVHAVGRLLRDQREAVGLSAAQVAKNLRIRLPFIEALEEGRFEQLPGAAYIPAFLRAYAHHIGLDPQKVLTAYQLSGSLPIERPVALPAAFPMAEKRAPIGLAVLTVLLVVGAGYAVWHYLPRQQAVVAEKVPPVPDRLLADRPSTSEVAHASKPVIVTPIQSQSSTSTALKAEPASPPSSQAPAPSQASAPPQIQVPSQAAAPSQAPATQQAQDVARPDTPVVPPPAVIAVPAAPPPVMMSAPTAGQALAAQPPAVDTQRPAADPQEAVVRPPPPENTDSAMVVATPTKSDTQVYVRSNSWVELRSPNGDVLAQTYVRAGESYVVPAGIAYRIIDAH
jgi:cytoskeleton protein RodZ